MNTDETRIQDMLFLSVFHPCWSVAIAPTMISEGIQKALANCLGPDGFSTSEFRDNRRIVVASERLYKALETLKKSAFDMLVDVTTGLD